MNWSRSQSAILDGSGNMLVSASAGSGKTTVMVEKVLRLLKEGVDIRRILLMTFTRAASREMREKLVKKMYEASGESDEIKSQLMNLPFANIETIDGFCFQLMRKYFNVAECDPGVGVGEENDMKIALDECVVKAMEGLFAADGDGKYAEATGFFRKKRSYEPFKQTVLSVIAFASTRPDRDSFYEKCATDNTLAIEEYYFVHRKREAGLLLTELDFFLEKCSEEGYKAAGAAYAEAKERLRSGISRTDIREFISIISGITVPPKINKRYVDKGDVSAELAIRSSVVNGRIKAFAEKVEDDGQAYLRTGDQQSLIKKKIAETCILAEKEYAAFKRRRNLVDMRDATDYALKILSNDSVREEIKGKFDYVFVDEYQDTNYLQEALIEGVTDNNMFSVGDVKQAIYHFRSAEPDIFLKRWERFASGDGGTNYFLNVNYRSCSEILDFTNRVCDKVMIKEFCGMDYRGTARLSYGDKIKSIVGVPAVSVYTDDSTRERKDPQRGGIYSVREAMTLDGADRESEFVAAEILRTVGKTEIEENGTLRKTGYGDIAVLVRTGGKIKPIVEAFDKRGIPYYTLKDDKAKFPERETLIDVLRVCFNADCDIPLYNALSSPVGGMTAEELTELRAGRFDCGEMSLWKSLNTYKGNLNIERKAKDFIDFIEKIRLSSIYLTAEETLREILSRNFDMFVKGKDAKTLGLLNAFIAHVGGLAVNSSCEDFLRYYDTCYTGNKPPVRSNAVAIMTMHGSKGLEFPVVFLPYQDARGGGTVTNTELDGELGLGVRIFSEGERTVADSFTSKVIRMKCNDEERQELSRLMYVAFTRAKNRLVITGKKSKPPTSVFEGASVMQWILFAAEEDGELREVIRPLPEEETPIIAEKRAEKRPFSGSGLKKAYAFEKETKMPIKYSVSEVLKKEDAYGVNPYEQNNAAMAFGTAIHTVMQYIDYAAASVCEVEKEVHNMYDSGYLTEEELNSVDCEAIARTLNSELIREARKYPIKREQPFMMYVKVGDAEEKSLVQGVIDLLIDEGDGYVVVDFKTGNAGEEKLAERYSKQLALYAEGVEKILKKPVKRKVIYSVVSGICVEV